MAPPTNAQLRNQVAQLKRAKNQQRNAPRNRVINPRDAEAICSVTNPFCEVSRHSKWPDGSSLPTIPVPQRTRILVQTDSEGFATMLFTTGNVGYRVDGLIGKVVLDDIYNPGQPTAVFNPETGVDLGTTPIQYQPSLMWANEVRTVSCGFKFTPVLSLMEATGYATFCEVEDQEIADDPGKTRPPYRYDIMSMQRTVIVSSPLRSDSSLYITARPEGTASRQFVTRKPTPEYAYNTLYHTNWSNILFSVSGAPTNRVIGYIDVYSNVEAVPRSAINHTGEIGHDDNSFTFLATRASTDNPTLRKWAQNVQRSVMPIVSNSDKHVDDTFMSRAKSIINDYIRPTASLAYAGYQLYRGNPNPSIRMITAPSSVTIEEVD